MSILIDNDTSLERYQNDFFFFEKNKKFRAFVLWSSFFMLTNGKNSWIPQRKIQKQQR